MMAPPFLVAGMRAGVSLSQRPAWSCLGHFSHLAPPTFIQDQSLREEYLFLSLLWLLAVRHSIHLQGSCSGAPRFCGGRLSNATYACSLSNLCMRNWRRLYRDSQPGAFCPQALGTYLTNTREWMLLPSTGWRPGVPLNP